jgi:hypothetical protein
MRKLLWLAALAAALSPMGAQAQRVDSYRTAQIGSSQGSAGWNTYPPRRRTMHASGFAIGGLLMMMAMAGTRR